MAIKDISWGTVILGAAAVTAFVAMAPAIGAAAGAGITILDSMTAALGSKALAVGAAAVAGGVAGEFVGDLLKRGREACSTLLAPRR